ncbi:Protein of unknown function [Bacillus cereus]|nr:Protein of unknown function [Bacillus cereus]
MIMESGNERWNYVAPYIGAWIEIGIYEKGTNRS